MVAKRIYVEMYLSGVKVYKVTERPNECRTLIYESNIQDTIPVDILKNMQYSKIIVHYNY